MGKGLHTRPRVEGEKSIWREREGQTWQYKKKKKDTKTEGEFWGGGGMSMEAGFKVELGKKSSE